MLAACWPHVQTHKQSDIYEKKEKTHAKKTVYWEGRLWLCEGPDVYTVYHAHYKYMHMFMKHVCNIHVYMYMCAVL